MLYNIQKRKLPSRSENDIYSKPRNKWVRQLVENVKLPSLSPIHELNCHKMCNNNILLKKKYQTFFPFGHEFLVDSCLILWQQLTREIKRNEAVPHGITTTEVGAIKICYCCLYVLLLLCSNGNKRADIQNCNITTLCHNITQKILAARKVAKLFC